MKDFAKILMIFAQSIGLYPILQKRRKRIVMITGGVIYINFINGEIETIHMW